MKGTSTVRVDAGIFGVKTIEKGSPVSDALPRSVEGRPVLAAILNNMAVPLIGARRGGLQGFHLLSGGESRDDAFSGA